MVKLYKTYLLKYQITADLQAYLFLKDINQQCPILTNLYRL